MTDVISINNKEINEDFRKFYWYDNLHHINNRIVKAQEYLINQYFKGIVKLDDIVKMQDKEKLYDYFKDFGFGSYTINKQSIIEYPDEYNDLYRTHFIVIDYIKKKGS